MRDIDYIVVHCSATSFGKDLDVYDIDRMHKRRGWSGVGYNYVVKLDGTIQNGRPLEKIPAHVSARFCTAAGIICRHSTGRHQYVRGRKLRSIYGFCKIAGGNQPSGNGPGDAEI